MVRGSSSNANATVVQAPPMEYNSSPYYLHPSDNPSLQLVPHVLTGSNYIHWSRSVNTALLAKNKIAFVNGVLRRPHDDDLMFPAWLRCNSMVVSWLRNSISPQICSSIMYLEDAHEIWSDLRIRFSQLDSTRAYQLRQRIMSLTQGKDDVNGYFTNLRIVWDEFKHSQPVAWCICANCRCNSASKWHEYQEQECTMQFLIGLNPAFSQIRSSIFSMIAITPLSKVFSLVLQEERQRTIDGYSPVIPSPMSEQPYSANAASSQSYNKGRICSHCGKSNHTVDKCFALHGYPPGFGKGNNKFGASGKETKSVNFVEDCIEDSCDRSAFSPSMSMPSQEQCQQLISLLQSQLAAAATLPPSTTPNHSNSAAPNMPSSPHNNSFTGTTFFTNSSVNSISKSQSVWLLDTGATHHVCCDLSMFNSTSPIQNAFVNLPNGATAPVTHTGTIHLTPSITLYSVLYVPTFSFNLISVSTLTSSLSCTVVFTHNSIEIQGASQEIVIGKGSRFGNLYTLDVEGSVIPSSFTSSVDVAYANSVASIDVWHKRLGHVSFGKLKSMSDILNFPNKALSLCDICPLAKQKHLPFSKSDSNAINCFDLIHCDVWGPFNPSTPQGYKYFLTIVDDCSRFVWTFLMHNKSDVGAILPQFFNTVLTQFSKKIKAIRCDNAPELNIPSLFSSFGTVIQHSCVEIPQQNARVERKHQHLLNVACSLLFQSFLPIHFWGDCILTASYLINRVPSSVLPDNMTPFQVLFQKPPSYSHLKVIGCLCYASTLERGRDKFSPRAIKCALLGYPSDYKGYKLIYLDSMQEIITRNVAFHEDVFPFWHLSPSNFPTFHQPSQSTEPESHIPTTSDTHNITPTPTKPTTSRHGRNIKPPSHLTDFICNSVASTTPYPISSYFSLSKLSPEYLKYVVLISAIYEPATYNQASQHEEWQQAMQDELAAFS